jgi:RNA polymerase sigma factor (sigma-70 family)
MFIPSSDDPCDNDPRSDEQLLSSYHQSGDHAARKLLISRYESRVSRNAKYWARAHGFQDADVKDFRQQSLLLLVELVDKVPAPGPGKPIDCPFAAYVAMHVRWQLCDGLRQRSRERALAEKQRITYDPHGRATTEASVVETEAQEHQADERLAEELRAKSEEDQRLFEHLRNDTPTREISIAEGVHPSTIRRRKKKLIDALHAKLDGLWPD